jgi:type IV secretion system protein VirD4
MTLLRGYNVQTWSFWQDYSQISRLYSDSESLINNAKVLQCFGASNMLMAESVSKLVGSFHPIDVLSIDDDEMVLSVYGDTPVVARKPDYRSDPAFQGLSDPNPYYRDGHEPKLDGGYQLTDLSKKPPVRGRRVPAGVSNTSHKQGN